MHTVKIPNSRLSARLVFGILGVVACAVAVVIAQRDLPYWLIPLGFGLVALTPFFAKAELPILELRGDPTTSSIQLLLPRGRVLCLPRSAVAKAHITEHQHRDSERLRTSFGVALEKVDGGLLALAGETSSRQRAESLVQALEGLLSNTPSDPEAEEQLVELARERLLGSSRVEVETVSAPGGDYRSGARPALQVAWSLASAASTIALIPLGFGGLVVAVCGMLSVRPRYAAFAWVFLLVVSLLRFVRSRGVRRLVRVDDEGLHWIQQRNGKTIEERMLALEAVDAVDVPLSGPLMIRIHEANAEIEQAKSAKESSRLGIVEIARGLSGILRQTVLLELGSLAVDERFDLELVLGTEVARRTNQQLGRL